jgi:hypothetical protein
VVQKGRTKEGMGELTEGERNSGVVVRRQRGGGLIERARTQGRGERGWRVTGCSSALAREGEQGKKRGWGHNGDGAPFIGDAVGVGSRPRAVRHGGGASSQHGSWVARCDRHRLGRGAHGWRARGSHATGAETWEGDTDERAPAQ